MRRFCLCFYLPLGIGCGVHLPDVPYSPAVHGGAIRLPREASGQISFWPFSAEDAVRHVSMMSFHLERRIANRTELLASGRAVALVFQCRLQSNPPSQKHLRGRACKSLRLRVPCTQKTKAMAGPAP